MAASRSSLKGLVSLITGGASGLGRATAERFIRAGAKVVICDLPTSAGEAVARTLGESCVYTPADVTSETDVQKTLDVVKSKFRKLDVVVNCAGVSVAFKVYNFNKDRPTSLEEFSEVQKTNISGTFNVNRLAVKLLEANEADEEGQKGIIINTSGISAFDGIMGQSAYSSSAGAISSSTLPIARDLASKGIRCCSIAPGYFQTELHAPLPHEVTKFIADATPFPKRLGSPDEFAHLVQTIIEIPYFNGTTIRLDGGIRFHL